MERLRLPHLDKKGGYGWFDEPHDVAPGTGGRVAPVVGRDGLTHIELEVIFTERDKSRSAADGGMGPGTEKSAAPKRHAERKAHALEARHWAAMCARGEAAAERRSVRGASCVSRLNGSKNRNMHARAAGGSEEKRPLEASDSTESGGAKGRPRVVLRGRTAESAPARAEGSRVLICPDPVRAGACPMTCRAGPKVRGSRRCPRDDAHARVARGRRRRWRRASRRAARRAAAAATHVPPAWR